MFDRKELKARAKIAFKRNYWKCVVVALILAILTAAAAGSTANNSNHGSNSNNSALVINNQQYTPEQMQDMSEEELLNLITSGGSISTVPQHKAVGIAAGALAFSGTALLLLKIFVWNLFTIGGARFFVRNTDEPANIGELLFAFKNNYLDNVVCMLLLNLFVTLWSLLLVIPGIIKHYSWYLVPYILADNPDMARKEAFDLSTELMRGNKWSTFVMELSFIGWEILSGITGGILGVFYVNPYKRAAFAELYRELRYGRGVSYIG